VIDATSKADATSATNHALPAWQELESLFFQKHGSPELVGWSPRRRLRFGYFVPADVYESLVNRLVVPGCVWLDVGGGRAIFPDNPGLARELASRCTKVVAVDPNANVHENPFVHVRVQSELDEYSPGAQFDLATMRMVVEHVSSPERFVRGLARLVKPGGTAVVFTVNRRSPITLLSRLLPFWMHHPIKRFFWGGEEKDTFPVHYRMNTREELRRLFGEGGFEEQMFAKLDDLSLFGHFKWLSYIELLVWSAMCRIGIHYPENCLLALYRRKLPGS
jgi:2-polyprenyl-3-methyl-5-hydroxy-6-metoxy-1,4-benzoquinol methylase